MAGEIPRNPMAGTQKRKISTSAKIVGTLMFLAFGVIFFAVLTAVVQIAWNHGITNAIGGNDIEYWEAWSLTLGLFIVKFIFNGTTRG